ncbi:hypothetical protein HOF92_01930 [bacterium]|jgi:hypothetical protein|nr:hypothetical protein [bacterium]
MVFFARERKLIIWSSRDFSPSGTGPKKTFALAKEEKISPKRRRNLKMTFVLEKVPMVYSTSQPRKKPIAAKISKKKGQAIVNLDVFFEP